MSTPLTPLSILFAYMTLGFCVAFPSLACSYVMIDTLKFTAADVATTALLCAVPWCVKPLFATLSDRCVCCFGGYRRRPWVHVFSLCTVVTMASTPAYAAVDTSGWFVLMLVCTSTSLCVVDVAIDGSLLTLIADESDADEGKLQTHSWTARIAGGCLASGWSGYAYETLGFDSILTGCAMLPLILSIVAFDLPDVAVDPRRAPSLQCRTVLRDVVAGLFACRYTLAGAVLVSLVPEINTSLFFYLLSAKASPKQMALVDVSGAISSLVTLGLYNVLRPNHKCSFFTGVVLNAVAAACGAALADDAVPWLLEGAAAEAVLAAVGSALILMPLVTVLGKTAAQTRNEATTYSCALSVLNMASVLSETIAANAMRQLRIEKGDVNNVRVFVGVVSVLTLMTAPAACLLPSRLGDAPKPHAYQVAHTQPAVATDLSAFSIGGDDSSEDFSDDGSKHADDPDPKHSEVVPVTSAAAAHPSRQMPPV